MRVTTHRYSTGGEEGLTFKPRGKGGRIYGSDEIKQAEICIYSMKNMTHLKVLPIIK